MDKGGGASDKAAFLAGGRAKEKATFEEQKQALSAQTLSSLPKDITSRFASKSAATLASEAFLLDRTVGLLTQDEYKAALEAAKAREEEVRLAPPPESAPSKASAPQAAPGAGAAGVKRKSTAMLSFGGDDEDDNEGGGEEEEEREERGGKAVGAAKQAKRGEGAGGGGFVGKDPTIATSFLPDAAREAREAAQRQSAKEEWLKLQEAIKGEALSVVYSYWDGTGHRRELTVTKGSSIGKFLEAARADLAKEFPELRATSVSSLVYVKEDLIIPHHHTFYELISTGARGKSGPLFSFDVHDDVRLTMDSRVEKDESHPGKVLDARWYQRNKHIFPYSRWEIYDPKESRSERYTIS